jgi:hypothetical protein
MYESDVWTNKLIAATSPHIQDIHTMTAANFLKSITQGRNISDLTIDLLIITIAVVYLMSHLYI